MFEKLYSETFFNSKVAFQDFVSQCLQKVGSI